MTCEIVIRWTIIKMLTGVVRVDRYIAASFGIDRLDPPGDNRREVEARRVIIKAYGRRPVAPCRDQTR
jgi:hypothetical protein